MAALEEKGDIANRHKEVAEQEDRGKQVGVAGQLQRSDTHRIQQQADEQDSPPGSGPALAWMLDLDDARTWHLLLGDLASATSLLRSGPRSVDVPYTLFKQQVEAGNVADIASRGDTIQGTFRQPVSVPSATAGGPDRSGTDFATVTPAFVDPGLDTLLEQQGVVINARSL